MKKVIAHIWKVICYPLLYLGMQVVVSFAYTVALAVALGIKIGMESAAYGRVMPHEDEIMNMVMSWFNATISILISGTAAILIIFLIKRKEWESESFWRFKDLKAAPALLCAGLGVALNLFTVGVFSLLPIPPQEQPFDLMLGNSLFLELLSLAVIGPVLEEIIFRGIIQKYLMKYMNIGGALIVQAFIFAFIHLNFTQGTYTFVLGMVLGVVYLWFGSIWLPVAIHVSYNASSVILVSIAGDTEIEAIYLIAMTVVALAVSVGSIYTLAEKRPKLSLFEKTVREPGGNFDGGDDDSGGDNGDSTPPFIG